jgi:DNA-binding XRE family transcriptional regulator
MEQNEAMEETKMEIGGRIAELLEKRGMTQRTLAAEIGSTEVSVSRYIKNQRTPNGPMILAIAKALGVSCDYLLGKSEEPKDGLRPCPFCGSSAEARMLYPTPFTKGMVAVFCENCGAAMILSGPLYCINDAKAAWNRRINK